MTKLGESTLNVLRNGTGKKLLWWILGLATTIALGLATAWGGHVETVMNMTAEDVVDLRERTTRVETKIDILVERVK